MNSQSLIQSIRNGVFRFYKYLGTFGYLSGPSTETGNYIAKEDFKKALKHLQKMGGIPQTGEPDQRTLELMTKPRCGVRDELDSKTLNRRGKRYVLAPSKWDKKDLTYRSSMLRLSTSGLLIYKKSTWTTQIVWDANLALVMKTKTENKFHRANEINYNLLQ
ncbi:hypothetical protein KUTeg_009549 [Tegillarca granosa]|uniref:Peptidoglycan binding-like domain-containing protein n=1 Tax=Tegillarca granosa TaxID=220873 RepID=A0ABQ9F7K3_TEGGR|nr:hypothetical protein KUTeg_009549 [Tegillarca granosa]